MPQMYKHGLKMSVHFLATAYEKGEMGGLDSLEATRLSGLPSGAWNVLERPDLGNGVYMESESGDVILPKSI